MPLKLRLTRKGKKGFAYYHIVVADSRAPRDGKFIERVGLYNPNTKPATIELDFDRALNWLQNGAQPTDTCKVLLSTKGVLLKKHLLEGVKKNALTAEQADAKFEAWKNEKEAKTETNKSKMVQEAASQAKAKLDAESKIRAAKAEAIAKKNAELAKEAKAAEAPAEEATDAPVENNEQA